MKPTVSLIVALSENRVIGHKDRVPWHIKEDLVRLKNLTKGKIVILGRKTYDSMVVYYDTSGRDMPAHTYVVVTSNPDYLPARKNAVAVHSLESALEVAKSRNQDEVFIIGGAQIFEQALPVADKLYLTVVHTEVEGDAFFPDYSDFTTVLSKKDSQNEAYKYTFLELTR